MKKVNVSVLYDEQKLCAIKLYMQQKDMNVKTELEKAVDVLYQKYVPTNVREFIDMSSAVAKPKRIVKPKTEVQDGEATE